MKNRALWRYGCSLAVIMAASLPGVAHATAGYFQMGYGMQNAGMGGTAYALTQGGMNGANNPANGSFADNQYDIGMYLFMPSRSASRSGNAYGLNGSATSESNFFPIPEIGYNQHLNDRFTIGLTVYGNGGMDTAYPGGQIPAGHCGPGSGPGNLLCGGGTLGVDLTQAIIAPTLSYKINDSVSLGIAPQFAIQQFSASGLQAFAPSSESPSNLTDRGYAYSYGAGVRVGGYWRVNTLLALGLTYQTQIYSTNLNQYSGLFAGGGSFNIPANLGVGMALHLTPDLLVATDYERIFYSGVAAVSNPGSNRSPIGSDNGPGFGWKSINVVKFGVAYKILPQFTVRAGYAYSDNPVTPENVTFNILAPGVTQHHISFGASYDVSPSSVFTIAYVHAFQNTVTGPETALPGGGVDTINLSENEIGIAYKHRF